MEGESNGGACESSTTSREPVTSPSRAGEARGEVDSPSRHNFSMTPMKKFLLVILGPTATGKSDLAVRLAKMIARRRLGGFRGAEIISADSRQVYTGLNIGTGKITKIEMKGVRHHLLDVVSPQKQFSVFQFKRLAQNMIHDIERRRNLPIICGGTGYYIDALLSNESLPDVKQDKLLRKKLSKMNAPALFQMLRKLDKHRAFKMNESDRQNPRRLIRAIEVARHSASSNKNEGRVTSSQPATRTSRMVTFDTPLDHNYDSFLIGLKAPTAVLRKRIHERLVKRIHQGMVSEARKLHLPANLGGQGLSFKRMDELGLEYRYLAKYLQGNMNREEMILKLDIEIGRYAKRQMTWFKRNKRIKWFGLGEYRKIEKIVCNGLNKQH